MTHSTDEARRRLCALGDHVRDTVIGARGIDMAAVDSHTAADTIYGIDRVADDALLDWFEANWPGVEVVSEGLEEPVVVGTTAEWTVIVDTIDGTRGLMYDKRAAWCLAGAAPHGGSLADIVASAMTELPTVKAGHADQLSGTRGGGVTAQRIDLSTGHREALAIRPSSATDLEHGFGGFAKFFVPGKVALAALEAELFERLGCQDVFDDEYISSGGQIHELLTGRDRFVADLRPLVAAGRSRLPPLRRVHRVPARRGRRGGHRPVGGTAGRRPRHHVADRLGRLRQRGPGRAHRSRPRRARR